MAAFFQTVFTISSQASAWFFLLNQLVLMCESLICFQINYTLSLMERRPWTTHEDQVLKNLYEKVKVNKWSLIARRMQEEFELPPRSGKQCRQRYNNILNSLLAKDTWTQQEEHELLRLHDELGNKWAVIGARLSGRTDNSVKNHFFAKLRKSMRKINKIVQDEHRKRLKPIKLNVLYKIIEASEERFKKNPLCTIETSKFSCVLKNKIMAFAYDQLPRVVSQEFTTFITQIHDFGKDYKRKPKQLRRVASLGSDLPQNNSFKIQDNEEDSNEDSQDEIVHQQLLLWSEPEDDNSEGSAERKMRLRPKKTSRMSEQEIPEKVNVDNLLEHQGLLEQSNSPLPALPILTRRYTSSEFLMEGRDQEPFFLQESPILPTPMFDHCFKKESQEEGFL